MPLVFVKRLTVEGGVVQPGDPVTPELRKKLGKHRLKIWWKARVVASAEAAAAYGLGKKPQLETSMTPVGGGWYSVVRPGHGPVKVRGKQAALALSV